MKGHEVHSIAPEAWSLRTNTRRPYRGAQIWLIRRDNILTFRFSRTWEKKRFLNSEIVLVVACPEVYIAKGDSSTF